MPLLVPESDNYTVALLEVVEALDRTLDVAALPGAAGGRPIRARKFNKVEADYLVTDQAQLCRRFDCADS